MQPLQISTTSWWCIMWLKESSMGSQLETTSGLTTTDAPFIEATKRAVQLYISQPYDLYSEENHEAWRRLYARMSPRWERYANQHYLRGIRSLGLDPNQVPRLEDVNRFLRPLTGFQATAVSGYLPSFLFFH